MPSANVIFIRDAESIADGGNDESESEDDDFQGPFIARMAFKVRFLPWSLIATI